MSTPGAGRLSAGDHARTADNTAGSATGSPSSWKLSASSVMVAATSREGTVSTAARNSGWPVLRAAPATHPPALVAVRHSLRGCVMPASIRWRAHAKVSCTPAVLCAPRPASCHAGPSKPPPRTCATAHTTPCASSAALAAVWPSPSSLPYAPYTASTQGAPAGRLLPCCSATCRLSKARERGTGVPSSDVAHTLTCVMPAWSTVVLLGEVPNPCASTPGLAGVCSVAAAAAWLAG
mmetsp:Transcript_33784/g.85551  ORF Transcript_33784/g.85551 Transcript_33784/m.85551 type:complete len:236 (-) Transcript_33784:511-1218(-)